MSLRAARNSRPGFQSLGESQGLEVTLGESLPCMGLSFSNLRMAAGHSSLRPGQVIGSGDRL